jgi:hypothetical protein
MCPNPPSTKEAYKWSDKVFLGEHIGTIKLADFKDNFGNPYTVENFRVVEAYKGIDTATFANHNEVGKAFIVSIISNCEKSVCGQCFQQNASYLVYATRDLDSGLLIAGLCGRTKTLLAGKNAEEKAALLTGWKGEISELQKLAVTTPDSERFDYRHTLEAREGKYKESIEYLRLQMEKKDIWLEICMWLMIASLFIIAYLFLKLFQKKAPFSNPSTDY